jgi:E3 ubiquitin-protein ligase NEDD4
MTLFTHTNFFAGSSSDNDITDVLELTFSTDDDQFGEVVSVDLKENGSEIAVTEENKKEYVE